MCPSCNQRLAALLSIHLVNTWKRQILIAVNREEGQPVANKNDCRCFMPIHCFYHIENILALHLQIATVSFTVMTFKLARTSSKSWPAQKTFLIVQQKKEATDTMPELISQSHLQLRRGHGLLHPWLQLWLSPSSFPQQVQMKVCKHMPKYTGLWVDETFWTIIIPATKSKLQDGCN